MGDATDNETRSITFGKTTLCLESDHHRARNFENFIVHEAEIRKITIDHREPMPRFRQALLEHHGNIEAFVKGLESLILIDLASRKSQKIILGKRLGQPRKHLGIIVELNRRKQFHQGLSRFGVFDAFPGKIRSSIHTASGNHFLPLALIEERGQFALDDSEPEFPLTEEKDSLPSPGNMYPARLEAFLLVEHSTLTRKVEASSRATFGTPSANFEARRLSRRKMENHGLKLTSLFRLDSFHVTGTLGKDFDLIGIPGYLLAIEFESKVYVFHT